MTYRRSAETSFTAVLLQHDMQKQLEEYWVNYTAALLARDAGEMERWVTGGNERDLKIAECHCAEQCNENTVGFQLPHQHASGVKEESQDVVLCSEKPGIIVVPDGQSSSGERENTQMKAFFAI